jgi:dephospho-CoA kinase
VSTFDHQNDEESQANEVQPLTHEQMLQRAREINDHIEQNNQKMSNTLDQVEQMIEELERSL